MGCCMHSNEVSDLEFIAKLEETENGQKQKGMTVFEHCLLTGLVAKELINRFPPPLRNLFPSGSELVCAIHDVGKINVLFQDKIRRNITYPNGYVERLSEKSDQEIATREEDTGYHSGVSYITLLKENKNVAKIIGSHHGDIPNVLRLCDESEKIGGKEWSQSRHQLIDTLKKLFNCDLPEIENKDISIPLIAGLTSVSDWIASSIENKNFSLEMVSLIIDRAGFITPRIKRNLSFQEVFNGFTPNPLQSELTNMITGPGVYVVEAQMGEGKTEAALYAAYKLLENNQASGIYFALPTQLTSNKIYERFNSFLDNILCEEDNHKSLLLHSKAWLQNTHLESSGDTECNPGYSWFNNKKRALLSPFAVGTIDQALLSVINVRHFFVRLFGLANKVIILDEIHSYDIYTSTLIIKLIATLKRINSTVIILSATLSDAQKQLILNANSLQKEANYPLITKIENHNDNPFFSKFISSQNRDVIISYIKDDNEQVIDEVKGKLLEKQQIIWIENTVQEAQEIYKLFSDFANSSDIEIGLLHSRFLSQDREKIEKQWTKKFGKQGHNERNIRGRLLIGTQILEQSLDLDADYMVSRIAPSDMLLQRIGRLWRHRDNDNIRPKNASPQFVVLSTKLDSIIENPNNAFGLSGVIYPPYVLYRTAKLWQELTSISIPKDLRYIIDNTYSEEKNIPESIKKSKDELVKKNEDLQRHATNSMSIIGKAIDDDAASTRYSSKDESSSRLLLISSYSNNKLELVNGFSFDVNKHYSAMDKKRISMQLEECIIRVPQIIDLDDNRHLLSSIQKFLYINKNEKLKIGRLQPCNTIVSLNSNDTNNKKMSYTNQKGFQIKKQEN